MAGVPADHWLFSGRAGQSPFVPERQAGTNTVYSFPVFSLGMKGLRQDGSNSESGCDSRHLEDLIRTRDGIFRAISRQ
jgi:hypothetical protein